MACPLWLAEGVISYRRVKLPSGLSGRLYLTCMPSYYRDVVIHTRVSPALARRPRGGDPFETFQDTLARVKCALQSAA